jgi:hypothetical protein
MVIIASIALPVAVADARHTRSSAAKSSSNISTLKTKCEQKNWYYLKNPNGSVQKKRAIFDAAYVWHDGKCEIVGGRPISKRWK